MREFQQPDPKIRAQIESSAHANSNLCWTCGSCDFECPVNLATGRLRPQKIVRMATLGFGEELLNLPEVWYCLNCRRCMQICPNAVKPALLIEYLRAESLRQGRMPVETARRYRELFECFQRVRWHAAAYCVDNRLDALEDRRWQQWLDSPVSDHCSTIQPELSGNGVAAAAADARMSACFTCGECSSACPVAAGREVFDPRVLFRMVNLGLTEALIASPAIWLCIACRRCTEACSQKVDGEKMIANLRKLALERGAVDADYPHRLEQADRVIYQRFLDEIDALFGFSHSSRAANEAFCLPANPPPVCSEPASA